MKKSHLILDLCKQVANKTSLTKVDASKPSWTGLCVRHNHNGKWHNKRIQTDTLGKLVMHCNNHLILGGTTN